MSFWCEGDLKVRGTKENIIKFILEDLQPIKYVSFKDCNEPELEPLKFDLDGRNIISEKPCKIKGTYKGYVLNLRIDITNLYVNEPTPIVVLNTHFLWDINSSELLNLCKKYNVDMKIYSFSKHEFNRSIEIVNGKIILDEKIEFDDYEWECICPNKGDNL